MFLARAMRRCSTAPADALHAAAVTSAERRSPITRPVTPGALGGPGDRAEVLHVLDLVEHDEERRSTASSSASPT